MITIPQVATAMQTILGPVADHAARGRPAGELVHHQPGEVRLNCSWTAMAYLEWRRGRDRGPAMARQQAADGRCGHRLVDPRLIGGLDRLGHQHPAGLGLGEEERQQRVLLLGRQVGVVTGATLC